MGIEALQLPHRLRATRKCLAHPVNCLVHNSRVVANYSNRHCKIITHSIRPLKIKCKVLVPSPRQPDQFHAQDQQTRSNLASNDSIAAQYCPSALVAISIAAVIIVLLHSNRMVIWCLIPDKCLNYARRTSNSYYHLRENKLQILSKIYNRQYQQVLGSKTTKIATIIMLYQPRIDCRNVV